MVTRQLSVGPLRQPADQLVSGHPEPYGALRRHTFEMLDAALAAVMPDHVLRQALAEDGTLTLDGGPVALGDGEGVHVLVVGKGSEGFARVAHERLPRAQGMVVAPEAGHAGDWTWFVAEHPVPEKGSLLAGEAAMAMAENVPEDGTFLVLLTGGASSLMDVPHVPLEDLAMTTNTLLTRGVTIQEQNTVRKHLSRLKGGQLAEACKGRIVTLAISDVPHDIPTDMGSGPTVPDPTTFGQALAILERVGKDNFPPVVVERIEQGATGKLEETPKPDDEEIFERATFQWLATNATARKAAAARARELGYTPTVLPSPIEGEARVVGETLAKRLVAEGSAIIAGGETTVSLKPEHKGGPGLGGRNQELALAAAINLEQTPVVVCGFGTDGVDGPTDAAGAIADGRTLERGLGKKRDAYQHLESNDSYSYFAALGDLIRSGPTGTNVMDLFIGLAAPEGGDAGDAADPGDPGR